MGWSGDEQQLTCWAQAATRSCLRLHLWLVHLSSLGKINTDVQVLYLLNNLSTIEGGVSPRCHSEHRTRFSGSVHADFPLSRATRRPWRAVGKDSFTGATIIRLHSWIKDELLSLAAPGLSSGHICKCRGSAYACAGIFIIPPPPNKGPKTSHSYTVYHLYSRVSVSIITWMSAAPAHLWLRYTGCWLRDVCLLQTVYYTSTQQFHIGLLSPTVDDDDNKCLVDVNGRLRLIECGYAAAKRMKLHWFFTQVNPPSSSWLLLLNHHA